MAVTVQTSCRTAVALLLLTACTVRAQDGQPQWLRANVGKLRTQITYDVFSACERDVEDQDTDLALVRHAFRVFAPLWQDETQEVAARATVGAWDLDTDARLERPGPHLPDHLWDLHFGGSWRRKLANDWTVGAGVDIGSPSDKPFETCEEVSVNAMANLRIPTGKRDAWLFFLQYSNNRPFAQHVPLPGIAYQWVPDPQRLRAVIGVPFANLQAEPINRLTINLRYLLLRRVHAQVGYRLLDPLKVYAAFDWDNHSFFRAGRADNDDRLFYYEKRLTAGIRWDIAEGLSVDVFTGYAFDRFFFEGEGYDDRGDSRINIADGTFAGIKVEYRF